MNSGWGRVGTADSALHVHGARLFQNPLLLGRVDPRRWCWWGFCCGRRVNQNQINGWFCSFLIVVCLSSEPDGSAEFWWFSCRRSGVLLTRQLSSQTQIGLNPMRSFVLTASCSLSACRTELAAGRQWVRTGSQQNAYPWTLTAALGRKRVWKKRQNRIRFWVHFFWITLFKNRKRQTFFFQLKLKNFLFYFKQKKLQFLSLRHKKSRISDGIWRIWISKLNLHLFTSTSLNAHD